MSEIPQYQSQSQSNYENLNEGNSQEQNQQIQQQLNDGQGRELMDYNQEMENQQQQNQNMQEYLFALNQNRLNYAEQDDYFGAENALHQISDMRQHAEDRIKEDLHQRHIIEKNEVEQLHKNEFENFTLEWDEKIRAFQNEGQIQIEQMRQRHEREMEELRVYLESSITTKFKPSPELLNLRKIQQHLSKQKNYTEAIKVQKAVEELENIESEKYAKKRDEKIRTQLAHMKNKYAQEREVLVQKIETILKEQDKIRKKDQERLLQKFLNVNNELHLQQQLESSKLNKSLLTKNYASTIVGKHEGSMKSVTPIIM